MAKYLFLLLLFVHFQSLAQKKLSLKGKYIEYGFMTGFGHGTSNLSLPEGVYRPVYFIGHFGMNLMKKITDPHFKRGIFTLYTEPQFNLAYVTRGHHIISDNVEFGINSGLKFMYPLLENLYIYVSGGTGPHFITVTTERQHTGFLFSENFGTGLYVFTSQKWAFNAGFRLRHMSNLNISDPNSGINTYNFNFGFSYFIR